MVTVRDFLRAREAVSPSLLESHQIQVLDPSTDKESLSASGADVREAKLWGTIGGLEEVKQRLRHAVIWPLRHPVAFERLGLEPTRGVLLYGPPGCGKTRLIRVLASCAGATFFALSGADVYSCYVGEAEATIRAVFARAPRCPRWSSSTRLTLSLEIVS